MLVTRRRVASKLACIAWTLSVSTAIDAQPCSSKAMTKAEIAVSLRARRSDSGTAGNDLGGDNIARLASFAHTGSTSRMSKAPMSLSKPAHGQFLKLFSISNGAGGIPKSPSPANTKPFSAFIGNPVCPHAPSRKSAKIFVSTGRGMNVVRAPHRSWTPCFGGETSRRRESNAHATCMRVDADGRCCCCCCCCRLRSTALRFGALACWFHTRKILGKRNMSEPWSSRFAPSMRRRSLSS
mmetsp:Transcript_4630/g.8744  ORF Transcript_4630/g.8744 Transcript_4630/m.8744 type:complete len:239 (-) Transcript_4630:488-1204(-)